MLRILLLVLLGILLYAAPIVVAFLMARCHVEVWQEEGGKSRFIVEPLGWLSRLADIQMTPIMYVLSGTFKESPQKTHRWNNCRWLSPEVVDALDHEKLKRFIGDPDAIKRGVVRFHLRIFGGWDKYVVVQPKCKPRRRWYIGWIHEFSAGLSLVPVRGPVRVLIGPSAVSFFAIDVEEGTQIDLDYLGEGQSGSGGEWAHTPLH